MNIQNNPLYKFEENLPQTRDGLLRLWSELAPKVRTVDPGRYYAVQEALEQQQIPFPVLVMYVFRECRRALEGNDLGKRAVQ